MEDWMEAWRLNSMTLVPEKVRVFHAAGEFVLIEGEDHTVWRGSLFDSPADAFIAAYADCERSRRYAEDRKNQLDRAKARFEAKGGE